jgi:hypothetical protein
MTQSLAISKNILTMAALQQRSSVIPSQDPQSFSEWATNLPELTPVEIDTLNQIKARFDYATFYKSSSKFDRSCFNLELQSKYQSPTPLVLSYHHQH